MAFGGKMFISKYVTDSIFYVLYTGVGSHQHQQHHQHVLQQSISEDSLQDEPLYSR